MESNSYYFLLQRIMQHLYRYPCYRVSYNDSCIVKVVSYILMPGSTSTCSITFIIMHQNYCILLLMIAISLLHLKSITSCSTLCTVSWKHFILNKFWHILQFAVAYNRRGIDETEKNSNEGSNQQALMDREQCFKVVAAAVKSVAENSVVDLRSPEVTLTDNCNSLHSYSMLVGWQTTSYLLRSKLENNKVLNAD